MRRRAVKSLCFCLTLASLCAVTSAPASSGEPERLHLTGYVFITPVDERRLLIAVSVAPGQSVEHLFLYTAGKTPRVPMVTLNLRNVRATVEFEGGRVLKIMPTSPRAQTIQFTGGPALTNSMVINFEWNAGAVHYIATPPLSIRELESVRVVGDCNLRPAACVDAAGQLLPFPE
ncbi:MAG: hypothetical protein WA825_07870 [Steroidobacteraceae bacterium]